MKTPKEDPKDKAARLRERRIAELERSASVRTEARGLTGDLRRTYGNCVLMFGLVQPIGTATRPSATPASVIGKGSASK